MGFSPEPVKKGLARVLSRGKLLLHLERVPRKSGKAGAASLGSVELEGMVRPPPRPSPQPPPALRPSPTHGGSSPAGRPLPCAARSHSVVSGSRLLPCDPA